MSTEKKAGWLEVAFQLDGSVVNTILPRILLFTSFAALVCLLLIVDCFRQETIVDRYNSKVYSDMDLDE